MKFENEQINKIVQYIKDKYNAEPEFLWKKFPEYAVFRNKDNSKWFGIIMHKISKEKLGFKNNENVDILDLKCDPILIGSLRNGVNYLPAYHMNKEHWITALLDSSLPIDDILRLIDMSYDLTKKK